MNSIATEESSAFVDNRLLEGMNIVNENDVPKVIDENGEPLVVYHWTEKSRFTSDLLHRAGIVGIRYNGRRDGECVVVFDENDVEVVNVERWSLSRDERISQLEKVVAEVKSDDIPILKSGILKSAVDWIERYPQAPANTIIGKVEFTKNNIKADFFHSSCPNKLATLSAVKAVLEKGVYLGKKQDKDGKPINNHYFSGTVKIDNEEKIVFVRVREAMGSASRFYVHEVYELEKIKNASRAFKTGPLGDYRARPAFYENIVADFINGVNQNQPRRLIPALIQVG